MDKFALLRKEIENLTKNSYAKIDSYHIQSVLKWVLKLKPESSIALKIAALGHDIDRSFSERKPKREDFDTYEKYKDAHAKMSAQIITELMQKYNFDAKTIGKVKFLIENHEIGGEEDVEILKEADSIAFFENNLDYYKKNYSLHHTKEKIKFMYKRLSDKTKRLIGEIELQNKDLENLFREAISECEN